MEPKLYGNDLSRASLPERIITAKQRREMIPYSDMHIWRLEKAGTFPRRIRLGPGRVGWRLSEILEWINKRSLETEVANDS